ISAKINKLTKDEEGYILEAEVKLNNKWVKINTRTSDLLYYDVTDASSLPVEISKIDNNSIYGLSAFYFPEKFEIGDKCDDENKIESDYKVFCNNIKNKDIGSLTISIEDYLSNLSVNTVNNVEKLIFFLITGYENEQ
ncbi:MAG: hypothetical protein WC981_03485, partial [Candidatus Dojkabacteria bacterium]